MTMTLPRLLSCGAILACAFAVAPRSAGQNPGPVFEFESALDTFFNPATGTLRLGDYTVAFAPEGAFRGEAAVVNASGKTVARFPFFDEYRARAAVFGRVQIKGPAEVQLTEPGDYNLIFLVAGKPVTRVAFALKAGAGGNDPYNPTRTFVLDGPWRKLAHVTTKSAGNQLIPYVTLWVGGPDLAAGTKQDMFAATLYRDGKVVAGTKKAQGHIGAGHFKRAEFTLFHPHEDRQAHAAKAFTSTDWLVNGPHELRVTRQSDGAVLRSFAFTVAGTGITPLARTQLGFEPRLNFILPRVAKKGSNVFEVIEAVWLEQR